MDVFMIAAGVYEVSGSKPRLARISDADALAMYHDLSIHQLGKLAFARLMEMHPEPYRTYVVDRNINYSNVCTAKCIFCNFKADPGDADAYTLTFEQIGRKIEELIEIGGTQILMQGGLVPALEAADGRGAKYNFALPSQPAGGTADTAVAQNAAAASRTGDTAEAQSTVDKAAAQSWGAKGGAGAGRLVPGRDMLPFEWYLDLLRFIRKEYPSIHIHAFSPPEIWAFHQVFKMPLRDVLLRLRDAGLATIPGGGGEILVDRVRRKIGQGKTLSHEWLEVMRQAHLLGMKTSCTMMIGHIETLEERIEHMRVLRDLQDETGGFTAFIHWPFQPEGTVLGRWKRLPTERTAADESTMDFGFRILDSGKADHGAKHDGAGTSLPRSADEDPSSARQTGRKGVQSKIRNPKSRILRPIPDGEHLLLADAHEYLVTLAIARLYFDNIPNIQSSWVTMGPKIGQIALYYGANDMGSVMMEENVVSQAGATYRLGENEIRRLITDAGWQPQQRDQYYRPINTPRRRVPLPIGQ